MEVFLFNLSALVVVAITVAAAVVVTAVIFVGVVLHTKSKFLIHVALQITCTITFRQTNEPNHYSISAIFLG